MMRSPFHIERDAASKLLLLRRYISTTSPPHQSNSRYCPSKSRNQNPFHQQRHIILLFAHQGDTSPFFSSPLISVHP